LCCRSNRIFSSVTRTVSLCAERYLERAVKRF
jgi:hypothetical protein